MDSYTSLRPDEQKAEYRYQYEYEQSSYMEIVSHSAGQHMGQAVAPHVPDWRLHPLSLTVGSEIARQFHWKAETGTIYTYEHGLTCRYIHLDRISRQFCDQKRNPLSADRALAHAMPQPGEAVAHEPVIVEAQAAPQPLPALPAPTFAAQPVAPEPPMASQPVASQPLASHPFTGQSLVGQWKAASAVRDNSELSVGSFVRRADMEAEAQQSHERFTASAMKLLQQELPPGTGALVRIYRKLTMKASQVRTEEPRMRQVLAPLVPEAAQAMPVQPPMQAAPAQAAQLYAESAAVPQRPAPPASDRRELNVAAFTRRAA